jgi:TusA-related sulfurtransferase
MGLNTGGGVAKKSEQCCSEAEISEVKRALEQMPLEEILELLLRAPGVPRGIKEAVTAFAFDDLAI